MKTNVLAKTLQLNLMKDSLTKTKFKYSYFKNESFSGGVVKVYIEGKFSVSMEKSL